MTIHFDPPLTDDENNMIVDVASEARLSETEKIANVKRIVDKCIEERRRRAEQTTHIATEVALKGKIDAALSGEDIGSKAAALIALTE